MRNRFILAATVAATLHLAAPARAEPNPGAASRAARGADAVGRSADAETQPRVPLPFFHHGPNEADPDAFPGFPGSTGFPPKSHPAPGPGVEAPPAAAEAPPAKPPTRAEALDKLMDRLAKAQDADEARGIAGLVQRMWMQSGSDTADLLMSRAVTAMNGDRRDVAAALLDQIIALRPGWAEAWNKRATLRFLEDDDAGSMEDISHVLAIEPRHFGALSGMGFILERHGEDAAALKAMRRALAVYPQDDDVRKAADKLVPTVEGQDL